MNATAPRKYWYLFIGHSLSELGQKSIRFIVESDHPWTVGNSACGTVRGRNKKAAQGCQINHFSSSWCNPSLDISRGENLCFIPCAKKVLLEMDDCNLSSEEREELAQLEKDFF